MKKLFALLVVATVTLTAFTACSNSANNETTAQGETTTVAEETTTAVRLPQYDYDLSKYVTLGQYKEIDVDFVSENVTDEELAERMDQLLINNNYCSIKKLNDKTTVETGDNVNIDYAGTVDGVAFEGGTADATNLEIGSNSFIPGFEDGLIGKKVGSTSTIEVTFPSVYSNNPDLAGKLAEFEVTVNYIFEYIPNTPTDDIVNELTEGNYTTVEDLESYLMGYMKNEKVNQNKTASLEMAKKNAKITSVPEDEVTNYVDWMRSNYASQAESSSIKFSDYLEQNFQMTEEEFDNYLDEQAREKVSQELVVYAIAKAENIEVDDENYALMANAYANNNGTTLEVLEQQMGSGRITRMIMENNVVQFLYENSLQYVPETTTTAVSATAVIS